MDNIYIGDLKIGSKTEQYFIQQGYSKGYSNIALIKYWGKSNTNPIRCLTPSISLRVPNLYTFTKIYKTNDNHKFYINNILQNDKEIQKMINFISNFVNIKDYEEKNEFFNIKSYNSMPTSCGLSSSSSGFMALSLAVNKYFNLNKNKNQLINMCKYGSGSSSRGFYDICEWNLNDEIKKITTNIDFSMFAVIISEEKKAISSREGMKICKETSSNFNIWIETCKKDFFDMKNAFKNNDFTKIGKIAEKNAKLMHSTCQNANPKFSYLNEESYKVIKYVEKLRNNYLECYFTADAGANIKVFCRKNDGYNLYNLLKKLDKKIIRCI